MRFTRAFLDSEPLGKEPEIVAVAVEGAEQPAHLIDVGRHAVEVAHVQMLRLPNT